MRSSAAGAPGRPDKKATLLDRCCQQKYFRAVRFVVSALLAALLCTGNTFVSTARAGEYTVYSCQADDAGRNSSWSASATSVHVTAYSDGCGPGGGGLVARAGVEPAGSAAPAFDSATWRFEAPGGTAISQVSLAGRAYRAPGGRWGVGLSDQAGTYFVGGISSDAMAWDSSGWAAISTPGATTLYFGVLCANGTGCPTTSTGQASWGYARARADLLGARVRVVDESPPSINSVRGSLVGGYWVSGVAEVGFDSLDNTGTSRQAYSLAGLGREEAKACDYTRAAPCPTRTGSDFSVDTRSISDGERTVNLSSVDAAGNRASWSGTALIDNNPPEAPSQPQLQGTPASQWRAENSFTLVYSNPSRAGGAPLTSHDVQLCPVSAGGILDPSACDFTNRSGTPGIDTVSAPEPGRYRFRVRVNDALHSSAWSSWSDVLRFDDAEPGTPRVSFPSGWVNEQAAAGGLPLAPAAGPGGPVSGTSGFLVSRDASAEPAWVPATQAGTATYPYSSLPDGVTAISVVAVSGSGVRTAPSSAASGDVRKDTVAPSLSVTGAPPAGATVPYSVTLTASGNDQVSGMDGAPPDLPVADGGFVSFLLPSGFPTVFRGATGQLSPGEGSQSISITATDVAGNRSPRTQVLYTQDTRVPTGGLLPADRESPSRIRFLVSESCAGRASIELSTSPGNWQALPTTLADGIATSAVPSSVWDLGLPYTLRASVTDCAGNAATLDRWAAGPDAGLPIGQLTPPPRAQTTISASIGAASRSRASAARTRLVRARVRSRDGDPVAAARVRFETQPRATGAQWTSFGSQSTSSSGEASRSISNAYSQRIRVTIAGSDLFAPSVSNLIETSVRASSSISAKPTSLRNGRRLTLSGKLRGGHVARGLELTLYGKAPGSRKWIPVRSPVAVSRSGRWKATYRFTKTRVRTTYRFRVRIPARPDYPFASGYSASKRVTVRP